MNIQTMDLTKASVTFMDAMQVRLGLLDPFRKTGMRLGLIGFHFDADNPKHCKYLIICLLVASVKESEALFKILIDSNYTLLESILVQHGHTLSKNEIEFKSVKDIFKYFPHVELGLKLL